MCFRACAPVLTQLSFSKKTKQKKKPKESQLHSAKRGFHLWSRKWEKPCIRHRTSVCSVSPGGVDHSEQQHPSGALRCVEEQRPARVSASVFGLMIKALRPRNHFIPFRNTICLSLFPCIITSDDSAAALPKLTVAAEILDA